jgi:hypothetical protein
VAQSTSDCGNKNLMIYMSPNTPSRWRRSRCSLSSSSGCSAYRSGLLRAMSKDGAPTPAVVQALDEEISSIT